MTKNQIKAAALAIFTMRVTRSEKQSKSEINQRRIAIKKRLEERRFSALLLALRDEAA